MRSGFNEIEEIAKAPFEGRVHAGHEQCIRANSCGYGEVAGLFGAVLSAEGDAAHRNFNGLRPEKPLNGFCRGPCQAEV